jgi:hypothetical protein
MAKRRKVIPVTGRATAQAVSRRFTTAAARVRAQVRSCAFCGGQSGTGASFIPVLRFPLPILIPPTAPHSHLLVVSGRRTSGLSQSIPPQETKKN